MGHSLSVRPLLLVLVAACSSAQKPTPNPVPIDYAEIERATGTASPYVRPVPDMGTGAEKSPRDAGPITVDAWKSSSVP